MTETDTTRRAAVWIAYATAAIGAIAIAVPGHRPAARAARWLFGATLVAVFTALVWTMVTRGTGRGYLFEVIVICITWLGLLVGAVVLARLFRSPPEAAGPRPAG